MAAAAVIPVAATLAGVVEVASVAAAVVTTISPAIAAVFYNKTVQTLAAQLSLTFAL